MRSDSKRLLAHAGNRAKGWPQYLAWILVRYVALEKMSDHSLAQLLGVTSHDLLRLGLCLRPRAEHFIEDIRQISTKFNIDAVALAQVVRRVESVEAITAVNTNIAATETGLLMAARSRKKRQKDQNRKSRTEDASKS